MKTGGQYIGRPAAPAMSRQWNCAEEKRGCTRHFLVLFNQTSHRIAVAGQKYPGFILTGGAQCIQPGPGLKPQLLCCCITRRDSRHPAGHAKGTSIFPPQFGNEVRFLFADLLQITVQPFLIRIIDLAKLQ